MESSSMAFKDSWVNRLTTSSGGLSSKMDPATAVGNPTAWKLTRAILKNGVLSLYKPPSDIVIRRFDPELPLAEDNSSAAPAAPENISGPILQQVSPPLGHRNDQVFEDITYRGFDHHPGLGIDATGDVISATNEALCHSILFGTDSTLAKDAIFVLLIVTDVYSALATMKKYLEQFTPTVRAANPRVQATAVVARVALVIDKIVTSFMGMLLETNIHHALQEFVDAMTPLDDAATAGLKRAIYERHQHIGNLVYQRRHETDSSLAWQRESRDIRNPKIRAYLAAIDVRPDHVTLNDSAFNSMTPEIFIELVDADLLAGQISYMHLTFYNNWSPAEDISLFFKLSRHMYYKYNPLLFDSQEMHFLARLLTTHLFFSNLDASKRARVLERWINLGNALKALGDIVGWVAIAMVVCSVGVLRLRETWSSVSEHLTESVVKDWGFEVFEVEKRSKIDVLGKKTFRVSTEEMGEAYPKERAVPYFGDLCMGQIQDEESESEYYDFKLTTDRVSRIQTVLSGWKYYFSQVPQNDTFGPLAQPIVGIQKALYLMLREHATLPKLTTDQILQHSLQAEPIISGTYLKSHYAQPLPLNTGAFLPLIFTDTNPCYKLFAKSALIAASGILKESSKKPMKSRTSSDTSSSKLSSLDSDATTLNETNHISGFSRHLRLNPFGSGSRSSGMDITPSQISAHPNRSNLSIHSTLHSSSSIGPGTYISSPISSASGSSGSVLQRSNSFPPVSAGHPFAMTTGYRDVDLSSQQFMSQYSGHNLFVKSIRDVLNVGARLFNVKNDIVLKAFEEDITTPSSHFNGGNSQQSSRPSSFIETPSQRLSSHSSRRMSSQLANVSTRSSDMTAIAAAFEATQIDRHRHSFAPSSINVVVKAANFEKLVDILVLGVNEFSPLIDPSDIDSLQRGGTEGRIQSLNGFLKRPQFKIDMNIHTLTFFATFRSFSSCSNLVKSLRRRFSGAGSAALSIVEMDRLRQIQDAEGSNRTLVSGKYVTLDTEGDYPNWDADAQIDSDNSIAWRIVAQIQIGVLEACHLWVSRYFNDFMSDNQIRDEFLDLIQLFGQEIQYWRDVSLSPNSVKNSYGEGITINEDYKAYLEPMESLYKKVRNLFVKKSYRPADPLKQLSIGPVGYESESIVGVDQASLEKWLDDVDTVVHDLFSMMEVQDWLEVFEILEIQGIEPTGFFNYDCSPPVSEEDLVIQDIYSYMSELRKEKSHGKILECMPQAVQEIFKLHNNLVNYFLSQITDIYLSKENRIARFSSILKMLGICRSRMSCLKLFQEKGIINSDAQKNGMSARVPAFVESAIITAIVKPESRMFANSWIQAGLNLSYKQSVGTPNQSELYVPTIPVSNDDYLRPMTTCVGWLLERMLEIVCYVPNMSVENSSLINFDKRRYIYNLVTNVSEMSGNKFDDEFMDLDGAAINSHYHEPDTEHVQILRERLAYIVHPADHLYVINRKAIREAATKEAKQYPRNVMKSRVFVSYVQQELDKIRRERLSRETIERQASGANKDMSKKSGALHKLKGTSIISSSMSIHHDQASLSMPFSAKTSKSRFGGLLKAVRPLSMAFNSVSGERGGGNGSASENIVPINVLPNVNNLNDVRCKIIINIDLSKAKEFAVVDQKGCVVKISAENGEYGIQAKTNEDADEWVKLLNSGKKFAQYKEWTSSGCTTVFGIPLKIVCEREGRRIPFVVEKLLLEIERRGMEELGLYRVSGSVASVNLLRSQFDSGASVNMEDPRWYDINTVAGCLKLYLRELPEPVLTESLSADFIECGSQAMNDIEDLGPLYMTIKKLPEVNFAVLKRLMQHLGAVAALEEKNKMKTPNLAVVFSMSLVPSNGIEHMRATQNLINTMILYHEVLFDDFQPESEMMMADYGQEPELDEELETEYSTETDRQYQRDVMDQMHFYHEPEESDEDVPARDAVPELDPSYPQSLPMVREEHFHVYQFSRPRTEQQRGDATSKYYDYDEPGTSLLADFDLARNLELDDNYDRQPEAGHRLDNEKSRTTEVSENGTEKVNISDSATKETTHETGSAATETNNDVDASNADGASSARRDHDEFTEFKAY